MASAIRAAIYYREKRAGTLSKSTAGFEFAYEPAYLSDTSSRPISLSLPLRSEKYESKRLFSFFDGLLPEGWLLDIVSTAAKIDKNDRFGLLIHTGRDPLGAVSIQPLEKPDRE